MKYTFIGLFLAFTSASLDTEASTRVRFKCTVYNSHDNSIVASDPNLVVTFGKENTDTKPGILDIPEMSSTLFIFPDLNGGKPPTKRYGVSLMSHYTNVRGEIAGTDVLVYLEKQPVEFFIGATGIPLSKDGQSFSQGLRVVCSKNN